MSTFRPPQVPQQPRTFFTPGQPSGFPSVDMQTLQVSAYARQHAEIIQPASYAVLAAPPAAVPPSNLQIPLSARWPMEWITENYGLEFTPGQPLGIPVPRQSDQTQATWRPRIEIQQPPLFATRSPTPAFVPAPVLQMLPPVRWALEWIVETYAMDFTPGQAPGVPQPKQGEQAVAYWRMRAEILQTPSFAPPAPSIGFVPANGLIVPASMSPRYEWLFTVLRTNVVPQPSLQSVPPAPDQTVAMRPARRETLQVTTRFTPGQVVAAPTPRQSDQRAAYFRQRIEIQQPTIFEVIGAVSFLPPRVIVYPSAVRIIYVSGDRIVHVGGSRTSY